MGKRVAEEPAKEFALKQVYVPFRSFAVTKVTY